MQMTGYTKLFGSIVASTVWREPHTVRIVWITMLAMANKYGIVEASLPGLADLARVTIDECVEALDALSSPDEYSRTPDFEGRRIQKEEGGWKILNHGKYREKMGVDERREYLKMKQRESRNRRKSANPSTSVNGSSETSTPSTHADADADAQSDAEADTPAQNAPRHTVQPRKVASDTSAFDLFWEAYPKKKAKGDAEKAWAKMGCGKLAEQIMTTLAAAKVSHDWTKEGGQFVPYPATWLNRKGWEDQFQPALVLNGTRVNTEEPAGWREFCLANKYPVEEFRYAKDWIKSEFRRAGK